MKYVVALFWILLTGCLGYIPEQNNFGWIIGCYIPLFGLYIGTYRYFKTHHDFLFFIFLSVFLRALLLFAFPNLSDDIYRFLWDGYLIQDGVNPYLYTPTEYLSMVGPEATQYQRLYPELNSPDYYSVYPPICQLVFAIVTWLFKSNLFGAMVTMKVFFLIGETVTIYFLMKLTQLLGVNQQKVLLYALNPLIIIELMGNLHFEALMILFLVLALWAFVRKRFKFFGLFLGLSIGTKLLPLMFLPFFLWRARPNDLMRSMLMMSGVLLLMFLPFMGWDLVYHLSQSLNLYFQKFEFNASIYYIVRWIGYYIRGYNVIQTMGPVLYAITFVVIMYLAFAERHRSYRSLFERMLLAFTCYLILATTVHPWYLSMLVLFTVFTHFRYPIFWSALACFTYINYAYDPYHENLWIVGLEYVVVFMLLLIEVFKVPLAKLLVKYGLFWIKRKSHNP